MRISIAINTPSPVQTLHRRSRHGANTTSASHAAPSASITIVVPSDPTPPDNKPERFAALPASTILEKRRKPCPHPLLASLRQRTDPIDVSPRRNEACQHAPSVKRLAQGANSTRHSPKARRARQRIHPSPLHRSGTLPHGRRRMPPPHLAYNSKPEIRQNTVETIDPQSE